MKSDNKQKISSLFPEVNRCRALLDTGVLENAESPLQKSAFIELIISLDFVLNNCGRFGIKKPAWRDSTRNSEKISDVIHNLRDAVCHIDSPLHFWRPHNIVTSFNVFYGRVNAVQCGDDILGGEFADDVAFNYGGRIIYLNRHIKRLITEFEEAFQI